MTAFHPTAAEAEMMLQAGMITNPGPWADHSRKVGQAAAIIAARCPGMNRQKAETLGTLHDIGRSVGVMDMRHVVEGYRIAMEHGWPEVARISLTHSFTVKDAKTAVGCWDCPDSDVDMVQRFLDGIEYDDYDRLIQLCDYLADPWGFCILEKRMVDVTLRRGFNEHTTEKWRSAYKLLDYFEDRMGEKLYPLLPGIGEYMLNGK